jgi:hypothetical protein
LQPSRRRLTTTSDTRDGGRVEKKKLKYHVSSCCLLYLTALRSPSNVTFYLSDDSIEHRMFEIMLYSESERANVGQYVN